MIVLHIVYFEPQ